MTLNEYIEQLQNLIKENPLAANMEVIYSKDNEGNGYDGVYFSPTVGFFDDREFIPTEHMDEYEIEEDPNAVCIN